MMLKNISRAVRVARCNTGHGEAGPKPALQCAGLALWGGFCLSRIFMFYLLLFFYSIFSELSTMTFRVNLRAIRAKVWCKSLTPCGRVCGRAVRGAVCGNQLGVCCLDCQRCFASPEKERRHDHLLVLSQLRINQDTMINGLYASMSAITDGRIFVDNFMSI